MQKRIGFAVFKKKLFSHSIQSTIMHSQSFRGYHSASLLLSPQVSLTIARFLGAPRRLSVNAFLLLSPQVSLTVAPFLGAPRRYQSPLLPAGVGPDWGLALGPSVILWPFPVSWSVSPRSQVGACSESGNVGLKENLECHQVAHLLLPPGVPSLELDCATRLKGIALGPPEMLQKPSTTLGEFGELRFIMQAGPKELTL